MAIFVCNAFSGTQLIFSRAGPSAAFLWVPFPFGILLTFGKENTFSLLSLNRKILSPPKEMEQIKDLGVFARPKMIIL